jgi:pilus assembly protein CpaF
MQNDENNSGHFLRQLTDSLTRMTSVMETLMMPLQHYLQEHSYHAASAHAEFSLDRLIAESPVASLLSDDTISDILINGPSEIYVTRDNRLERTGITFSDARSLALLATAIAASAGRTIDPRRPLADARLKDGSRVNIIAPPMAVKGITVSIRKFPKQEITLETLVDRNEMTQEIAEFLMLCARARVSILISGGTATGKTTLLNAISRFIPESERIITIEDTAELRLQQSHVVRLETKEPSAIGNRSEEVSPSDLIRNALRMRPDRIIIGEVRGIEAFDMIQALNTGHDGSMSTVHANTPRDAFTRLENLMGPRMQNTSSESVRHQIVSAINLIIQLVYDQEHKRRISSITEIVGMERDTPTMQQIFKLSEDSVSAPEKIQYRQFWTGIIPRHARLSEAMRNSELFKPMLTRLAENEAV